MDEINGGWQPIETAPMDRRLLLWDGIWVSAGAYVDYDSMGWIMDSEYPGDVSNPTHWMPLPAPPAAEIAKGVASNG
jgi:hypothetical protein